MLRDINLDLFPTPFSIVNFGEESRELNKKILDIIFEEKQRNKSQLRTGVGVWQSVPNLETKHSLFEELKIMFFDRAKPILKKAGFTGELNSYLECSDFWANYNDSPYAYHTPHIHGTGRAIFSGVYYPSSGILNGKHISAKENLNTDPIIKSSGNPSPGNIVFLDPAAAIKGQVYPGEKLNRYPYYGLEICIEPREGLLVLFPQWLQHLVTPTEKEGFIRTSLAFNINMKR
jgi:hypothetical protein